MPFTPAHAIAVLPFWRKRATLPFTALVIGSIVPDYEYFIRMRFYGNYSHTLQGIFIFDLPVGFLLYILYLQVVQRPLIRHLPSPLFEKFCVPGLSRERTNLFKQSPLILLCLLAGIVTHLIWDGLTHGEEYYLASYLRFLLWNVKIVGHDVPIHRLLLIISSLLGMIVIVAFVYQLPLHFSHIQAKPSQKARFWLFTVSCTVLIAIVRWVFGLPGEMPERQFIVLLIGAFQWALLLTCFIFRVPR